MLNVVVRKSLVLLSALALANASSIVRAEAKGPSPSPQESASAAPLSAAQQGKVLEESRKVKANIELWPQRVGGKLNEVMERLETLDLQQLDSQRIVLSDFGEVLDTVDEEAAAIEQAWTGVQGEYALWRDAVTKAPDSFRAVAAMFEAKAAEHDDATLKLHYADFASIARALAKKYESKASQMASQQLEIERQIAFVGKSREFIKDAKSLLAAVPVTEEGIEVEIFCKRLNDYIKVFQTSVKLLKGMADQLGEEGQPPKAAAGPKHPSAAENQAPARPLTAEEYQSRLSALRRPR